MAQGSVRTRGQQLPKGWAKHRARWQPILLLAGGLFLANVIVRLIVLAVADNKGQRDLDRQTTIGLIWLVAVGITLVAATMWWSYRKLLSGVVADVGWAVLISCGLINGVGPFASGSHLYGNGGAFLWSQIWRYLAFCAVAMLVGFAIMTMLGKDYRSRQLKRYADHQRAHPTRV